MEGFIFENGAERKADLEDLLPLIFGGDSNRAKFQYFLRKASCSNINLAAAISHLPNEIKEMVYRNVPVRDGELYKENVGYYESKYEKDHPTLLEARTKLTDFLGNHEKDKLWQYSFLPKRVIWREIESEEEKTAKPSPHESFNKRVEEALGSGKLRMPYYTDRITHDEIRNALQNHQNDLHKIRELSIDGKYLPDAALLFETGKFENLCISDITDGEWPSFLENYHALTELTISNQLTGEFPSWIRNVSSLRKLFVFNSNIESLPDWIGDLQSLTELILDDILKMETLPDSIGNLKNLDRLIIDNSHIKDLPESISNLKNLRRLTLRYSPIEKIPDWIGDLQSLTELSLRNNRKLKTLPDSISNLKNLLELNIINLPIEKLPDSIGNLKNLRILSLDGLSIKNLPDWIGDMQSLAWLSLNNNKNLESLPDSIGNLKNLATLDISFSPIKELPCTIVNCTALKSVNIWRTKISSVPDFIKSVNNFSDNTEIEIIPMGYSLSYRCFCNNYYRLAETILAFNKKARREGLIALEDELAHHAEGFFKRGMWMVTEGTDAEYIRDVLQIRLEREHNFYRKKLLKVAMEGILSIQSGDSMTTLALLLASLVNIKDNPIDAAFAKYLSGDSDAIDNIDFSAAIKSEDVSEDLLFIDRAIGLSAMAHKQGLLALQEHLDHKGIARRDVFEYGLALVTDGWNIVYIVRILDNLIAQETDPVQKKLSQAKKEAVKAISEGDQPRLLLVKLCAFLDDADAADFLKYI